MAFKDEAGITRHALTTNQLEELRQKLDNFIADLTREEFTNNVKALTEVKALIHQRLREEKTYN